METLEKKYSRSHIGETRITKEGYECKIIDGGSKVGYCTIQINDWIAEVQYGNVKRGTIKYPYNPSVFNKGYVGEGSAVAKVNRKNTKVYQIWNGMLQRAYCPRYHVKKPTYKDVEVCEEWLNFNVFAEWFENNYIEEYHLDKDLLSLNNKVYSPDTCIFIPQALNSFLTNVKSDNTSGYTGVSWDKSCNKWVVSINNPKTGRYIHLGRFQSIERASQAYEKKRKVYSRYWKYLAKKVYNLPENAIKNIK